MIISPSATRQPLARGFRGFSTVEPPRTAGVTDKVGTRPSAVNVISASAPSILLLQYVLVQAIFYMLRHEPSSVTGRLFVFRPVGARDVGIGRGDAWCALRRRARAGLRLSIISYGPTLALTAACALTSRRMTRWPME